MFSTTGLVMAASAAFAMGCGPDGDPKATDSGSVGFEYGTVEPITSASHGLVAADYEALLGTTASAGSLGCAVIRDESASPGTATSLVYAKIRKGETGDTRCPRGTYSIVNDPMNCSVVLNGLFPGCVLYKQWDA